MLSRVGWWSDARLRVAQFLANLWQEPAWPSRHERRRQGPAALDRKRLAPQAALAETKERRPEETVEVHFSPEADGGYGRQR